MKNAIKHDISKYSWEESKYFAKTIFDLKHSVYGSPEFELLPTTSVGDSYELKTIVLIY
jgi:hypothetical protein